MKKVFRLLSARQAGERADSKEPKQKEKNKDE